MSIWRSLAEKTVSALIIAATIVGVYNVLADNAQVIAQAKQVACGGVDCSWTRQARYPWAQEFTFQGAAGSVNIKCTRSFLLVGPYTCIKR
jgi:hypothetical protein